MKIAVLILILISSAFAGIKPEYRKKDRWEQSEIWKPVTKLINEQKYKAARNYISKNFKEFKKDPKNWTIAIIQKQRLGMALGEAETSVEKLRAEKWPQGISSQFILNLYYAVALNNYYDTYSWEINQREQMVSQDKMDLKKWSKNNIFGEIQTTLLKLWKLRGDLVDTPVESFNKFINPGNYPSDVRGTLRDALSYFYVAFLSNTQLWTAEQSNDKGMLKLSSLMNKSERGKLSDPDLHPLKKINLILTDLENWHWKNDRVSALIEARLAMIRILKSQYNDESKRRKMDNFLKKYLRDYKIDKWWSEGYFLRAQITNEYQTETAQIEARKLAQMAVDAYPKSIGADRALGLISSIEAPSLRMMVMKWDRANQKSIQIEYKNWNRIYFRAYRYKPESHFIGSKNEVLPYRREAFKMIEKMKPFKEWKVDLNDPRDYRQHTKLINPELAKNGYYIITASANEGFKADNNHREFIYFNQTQMHPIMKSTEKGQLLKVVDALNGESLKGVKVKIYQQNWEDGFKLDGEYTTDKKGELELKEGLLRLRKRYSFFYTLERQGDYLLNENGFSVYGNERSARAYERTLTFTDRAIYRPGQKLHFKVITYENRSQFFKLPKAQPNRSVLVSLHDGNGEEVAKLNLTTNEFASASGEFEIPKGRFLGFWSLRVNHNHTTSIKVEEYKRPTFLTSLKDAKGEVRLNKKATFEGEAKYYFGLPLVDGQVKYTVKRTTIYPYWYRWWYPRGNNQAQIIEIGKVKTDDKGQYQISFTPQSETGKKDLQYSYEVSVEVLNEGGETAKASKYFTIGDVSVKAHLSHAETIFPGDKKRKLKIFRSDLNGKPMAGEGKIKLFKLEQPKNFIYPNQLPKYLGKKAPKKSPYKVEDDLNRNRWTPEFNSKQFLMSWKEGKEIANERLIHDKKGNAELDFGKLDAGAYRFIYSTKDKWGGVYETESDFIVVKKEMNLNLPFIMEVDTTYALIGDVIKIYLKSGHPGQKIYFQLFAQDKKLMDEVITEEKLIKYKVAKRDLGGINIKAYVVLDHKYHQLARTIAVPFVSRELALSWERIRKKVYPGTEESWTLKVEMKNERNEKKPLTEKAEVLAYMYDQSLDALASHNHPGINDLPTVMYANNFASSNGARSAYVMDDYWYRVRGITGLYGHTIRIFDAWGIGGFGVWRYRFNMVKMGSRGGGGKRLRKKEAAQSMIADDAEFDMAAEEGMAPPASMAKMDPSAAPAEKESKSELSEAEQPPEQPKQQIRSNFNETAFFIPQLKTDKKGNVSFKFTVPDSLTAWNVWANAVTKNLHFASLADSVESSKDLMVRTYIPRFLREGDKVKLKVLVDNTGSVDLSGKFFFELKSPYGEDLAAEFKLEQGFTSGKDFKVAKNSSENFTISLDVPFDRLGNLKIKAYAKTQKFTDGEEKEIPVLPSRMHLAQSRFVTLKNKETRELKFEDMLKPDDTLVHDSLIIKLDAQLFYSVLSALPYLVDYPYECSEQSMNKYVTTAILSQTYKDFPSIAKMAQKMSKRKTQFEALNADDPNRKMGLEETPWLRESRGEGADIEDLLNMLKPRIVKYQKDNSLKKVLKLQNSNGGFSWFAGGRPSFYMTKYVLYSFAKAAEFGVSVPKSNIKKAFRFTKNEFDRTISHCYAHESCWEWITYLNFIMSSYPDESYFSHAFSKVERQKMLNFSFKHWKRHQPMLKGMLALTLKREKRDKEANLVLESVMDSAKEERDLGVYWAPEDRSWLWYNDTIETHAFALRTLMEVKPKDAKKHGLVQWLFLNKKLNHWKSTRATAEVMYSLLYYLKAENLIGSKERANIKVGDISKDFEFVPEEYTGKDNFVVIKGKDIKPQKMSTIKVTQKTKGMMFASATWHYSTEKMPKEARSDFFNVTRTFYKRVSDKKGMKLIPLREGAKVDVGDQVEVHLSISTKHAAEYVHLRDPRPAGFEPERATSGYQWDLGLVRYEEVRDSGMNFFLEWMPVGEYTLKHRLRANMAGKFRTHPATLQSVYAPEFSAFSSGENIVVESN